MVAEHEPAPEFPCSPRSFAKAHLDRLRCESLALNAEVDELSQDFDSQSDEPESLTALRAQSAVLSSEVRNLEQVFQNATGNDSKQEIWDAVQRALRKRHLAELVSLRAAATLSGQTCTPKKPPRLDHCSSRKRASSRGSHKSSDNASSTETPTLRDSDSDTSDSNQDIPDGNQSACNTHTDVRSDAPYSSRSEESVTPRSYVIETAAPPKPMSVPPPKWAPSPVAPADLSYDCMPSPVCPDLRRPPKLTLPLEVRRLPVDPQQLDASADGGYRTLTNNSTNVISEASCLSMSIDDWFDPESRQIRNQPTPEKVPSSKRSQFGEDHMMTAMEEDVQTALQVLGFRRAKDDEEECESLLSTFWPLW